MGGNLRRQGGAQHHRPPDYDQIRDRLKLFVLANSAGTTDVPTLSVDIYRKRAATALSANLGPKLSTAVPISTANAAWKTIDCSLLGMKAGDALTLKLFPAAHGTDALNIYGIEFDYASLIFNRDSTDR
jgi:hypothetical protein